VTPPALAGRAAAPAHLRVLFAPDSFKGTLTSVEVAAAFAEGWARARPQDLRLLAPLADGGQGTLAAIEAANPAGLRRRTVSVEDPLGRAIDADYLLVDAGSTAIVELAQASGLARLTASELDARRASTDGTGELLLAAMRAGARRIVLGLGGSATTDGGSGLLRRLGARLIDADGHDVPPGGGALARVDRVDLRWLSEDLAATTIVIASDVTNPLLGASGAAAVYGPQKGATPVDVAALDAALAHWADVLEATTHRSVRGFTGSGAAGGTTAALLAIEDRLAGLTVRPGIDVVMELTRFDERLRQSDLVVTGEGRLDAQTAFGKTVWGVATRARTAGVRCAAIVGSVGPGGREAVATLVAPVVATSRTLAERDAAIAAGAAPLRDAAARLAKRVGATR
jgi:glycerate kinase